MPADVRQVRSTGPAAPPMVRVVVLNWNAADLTARCLRSVLSTRHHPDRLEVVVVDNGSVDGSLAQLRRDFPIVRIIENGANLGFAEGCNRALRDLDDVDYVALVNNDAVVEPGWLAPLLDVMDAQSDVGAACPKILLETPLVDVQVSAAGGAPPSVDRVTVDGLDVSARCVRFRGQPGRLGVPVGPAEDSAAVQLSFVGPASSIEVAAAGSTVARVGEAEVAAVVRFELAGPGTIRVNSLGLGLTEYSEGLELGYGEPDPGPTDAEARDVLGFSGGGVLLRTAALRQVGVFDPLWFAYYEDLDLSWRLRRAGWRIVCVPTSVVRHLQHGAGGPRSAFFQLANTRNWLLTVLRNGGLREIATAWRYGLARGWFASRRGRDRQTAVAWARIWLAVAWAAPGVLAQRITGRLVGAQPADRVGGPFLHPPTAVGPSGS